MSGCDADTVIDVLGTDAEQEDVLAAVVVIELVAYVNGIAKVPCAVACFFGNANALNNSLALGLSGVKEFNVVLCIFISFFYDLSTCQLVNCLFFIAKVLVFGHNYVLLYVFHFLKIQFDVELACFGNFLYVASG